MATTFGRGHKRNQYYDLIQSALICFGLLFSGTVLAAANLYANETSPCRQGLPPLPEQGVNLNIAESELMSEASIQLQIVDRKEYRALLRKQGGEEKTLAQLHLSQSVLPIPDDKREYLASFLLAPVQERSLIMGLHNIGLIKFLRSYTPSQSLDVVESSADLVQAIQTWFGLSSDNQLTLWQDSPSKWLQSRPRNYYDVIYLEAEALSGQHLLDQANAPDVADAVGVVEAIWQRLREQGVLLVTLASDHQQAINHQLIERRIDQILTVFPHVFVWDNPKYNTVMIAAFKHYRIVNPLILRERGRLLDQSLEAGFSFRAFVDRLVAGEYRRLEM